MKIWLSLIFILSSPFAYATSCDKKLNPLPGKSANATERLISYLDILIERQIVGATELAAFTNGLKSGRITNPITEDAVKTSSTLLVHQEEIRRQIQNKKLDIAQLKDWSETSLNEVRRVVGVRTDTKRVTEELHQRIEFYPVSNDKVITRVSPAVILGPYRFEMMTTTVTQKQWAALMGENPSQFQKGPESELVSFEGKAIRMSPDNPVENVNWWSAVEFANRLSIQAGLEPVYNLDNIRFTDDTRPERGDWRFESGTIRINSVNGNIDTAEGYRLPTTQEWGYVLSQTQSSRNRIVKDYAKASNYYWGFENSDNTTHPVGQLLPLQINGHNFYDLLGNVAIWQHIDNPKNEITHAVGKSFLEPLLIPLSPIGTAPSNTMQFTGFRLVRTLK